MIEMETHIPLLGAIYLIDGDVVLHQTPNPRETEIWINIVATVVTILMAGALGVLFWGFH